MSNAGEADLQGQEQERRYESRPRLISPQKTIKPKDRGKRLIHFVGLRSISHVVLLFETKPERTLEIGYANQVLGLLDVSRNYVDPTISFKAHVIGSERFSFQPTAMLNVVMTFVSNKPEETLADCLRYGRTDYAYFKDGSTNGFICVLWD